MEIKKIKVVVVGCGDRASRYCEEGVNQLKQMEIVAAIDPNQERLRYMREHFCLTEEQCYTNMQDVLAQGKIADCVINATMDSKHYETAIPFLKQGYHMLLEKPVVNNAEQLLEIQRVATENQCKLLVCHVLRYTSYYRKVKEMIDSGKLGEIMNIQTSERVGATHSSAAYVRGKWNSEKICGSSLLLAKCCHDIDMICWLNHGATPISVQSDGGRNYFVREKAPQGSGSRCMVDCPEEIRKNCVYDVQSMYLDNGWFDEYAWTCTGKNPQDVTEEEKVESLKTYNPHGRCIYKCDEGDIVDHQNVMIHFDNGSTAIHTVILGAMRPIRSLWIQGTKGELEGYADTGVLYYRDYDKGSSGCNQEEFKLVSNSEVGGHFGGDKGLMFDFCALMQGGEPSVSCTSIDDSITGHLLCYAADEAMKTKKLVEL